MEQGRREVAAHSLAKAQKSNWDVQERFKIERADQLVAGPVVVAGRYAIDVPQQIEGLYYRKVPPELGPLAEHHADVADMGYAVSPRHAAEDLAPSGVGLGCRR